MFFSGLGRTPSGCPLVSSVSTLQAGSSDSSPRLGWVSSVQSLLHGEQAQLSACSPGLAALPLSLECSGGLAGIPNGTVGYEKATRGWEGGLPASGS